MLRRIFTIQCKEDSELLTLPISKLNDMQDLFFASYSELFHATTVRLRRALQLKMKAMRFCRKHHVADSKGGDD